MSEPLLRVELHPASGRLPAADYWTAVVPCVGIACVALGVAGALQAVEAAIVRAIDLRRREDQELDELSTADELRRRGTLRHALERGVELNGWV